MNINFMAGNMLNIEGARLVYRNFRGEGSKYNREGDRNFAVIIPTQEMADALIREGWNVKIKPPREDDDIPFMYLPVKVKFNNRGPGAHLVTNGRQNPLDEESIAVLDDIMIQHADMYLRAFDWEVNGKTGRSAYLQSIRVTQRVDDPYADVYED